MKLKKIHDSLWNEVILTLLAIASVTLLVYELSLESINAQWLYELDFFIACIFLADFVIGLYVSESKKEYMKKNWHLLIASIPIPAELFQSLRALRILRLLRVIRMLARIKRLATLAEMVSPRGSRYIYITSLPLFTVFSGAVAIYTVEHDINPKLENFLTPSGGQLLRSRRWEMAILPLLHGKEKLLGLFSCSSALRSSEASPVW